MLEEKKEEEAKKVDSDEDCDIDPEVYDMVNKNERRRGGLDHRNEPTVPDEGQTGIGKINT